MPAAELPQLHGKTATGVAPAAVLGLRGRAITVEECPQIGVLRPAEG